jgi:hypothetical protein
VVAILVVWPCRVVCLSGVNAAANWWQHHLITFLNCATQLLKKGHASLGNLAGIFNQKHMFIGKNDVKMMNPG